MRRKTNLLPEPCLPDYSRLVLRVRISEGRVPKTLSMQWDQPPQIPRLSHLVDGILAESFNHGRATLPVPWCPASFARCP